jgi:hypothetical protein
MLSWLGSLELQQLGLESTDRERPLLKLLDEACAFLLELADDYILSLV